MYIDLIAVGTKMPDWVNQAFNDYAKRIPKNCALRLHEVQAGHRGKNADVKRAIAQEEKRIFELIPSSSKVVALEVNGKAWSTKNLAKELEDWMGSGSNIALLVGGPDGLSDACRKKASQQWSLSPLTLPHGLVRVVVAEQIYRAWSITANHPYHRS